MTSITVTVKGQQQEVTEDIIEKFRTKGRKMFDKYLSLISNQNIRAFAEHMLDKAPDYFYVIPASTSGKYHAQWATDLGGLVRHVVMGCEVAYELSRTFDLTDEETDMALAAMIGHDTLKYGIEFDLKYYDMHPFMPRSYYGSYKSVGYAGEFTKTLAFDTIMYAIERHMGNIMTGAWTSVGGIRPNTPLQHVVHLADYVSSRKNIVLADYVSGYDY